MSTRFTENIDQLDEFYRQSFEDGGMEPPADMWDRVESALDKDKKKKGFFSKRNILISIIAIMVLALITWWMMLLTDNSIPNSDFPTSEKQPSKSIEPSSQKEDPSPTKSESKKWLKSNRETRNSAQQETSIENPINKADSSTVIATDLKAQPDSSITTPEPKKRLRFRDKYKKMPADTIPLFIPE